MGFTRKTFYLNELQGNDLDEAARRFGLSRSQIVAEILRRSLPGLLKKGSFEFVAIEGEDS